MAGPGGISCWGPNASVHRGDFAAESSFSRKAQPKSMKQHPEHTLLAAWPASQPPMHAILRSQSQIPENINKIS
jgi:hypothetical protein